MKTLTVTNANGTEFTFTKTESDIVNIEVNNKGRVAKYITIKTASVRDGKLAASREDGSNVEMPINSALEVNDFLKGRELIKLETLEDVRNADADKKMGKAFQLNGEMHAYKYN